MKKKAVELIELFALFWRYKNHYFRYIFQKKSSIYKILKKEGCRRIKPTQRKSWKVYYGSQYYSAILKDNGVSTRVFVKVTSETTKDGFHNEKTVNEHIKRTSSFLYQRAPKLLRSFKSGEHYVLIFEYVNLQQIECPSSHASLDAALCEVIAEFKKAKIIHADFEFKNIGILNNQYYFFDYGYSICPESNNVRLPTQYNRPDCATSTALALIPEPDFYYDDAITCGNTTINREKINFIIGKGTQYFASLGNEIISYKLERISKDRPIYILIKQNAQ